MLEANTINSPAQTTSVVNKLKIDITGSFKSFYKELKELLKDFADPNDETITIEGVTYLDKSSPAVQLILSERLNDLESANSTLINLLQKQAEWEKDIGKV